MNGTLINADRVEMFWYTSTHLGFITDKDKGGVF